MRILITSATANEIQATLEHFGISGDNFPYVEINEKLSIAVTGVGMVATAFHLGKIFAEDDFDLAINVGIAGSFSEEISIGEVVSVKQDQIAELGAEDGENFLGLDDLGLGTEDDFIFRADEVRHLDHLRKVNAITVNRVHGKEGSIAQIRKRLKPEIESMEGAAFHYACRKSNIKAVQLRAISNSVEPRNKDNWNIPLAVKNLNRELIKMMEALT